MGTYRRAGLCIYALLSGLKALIGRGVQDLREQPCTNHVMIFCLPSDCGGEVSHNAIHRGVGGGGQNDSLIDHNSCKGSTVDSLGS